MNQGKYVILELQPKDRSVIFMNEMQYELLESQPKDCSSYTLYLHCIYIYN